MSKESEACCQKVDIESMYLKLVVSLKYIYINIHISKEGVARRKMRTQCLYSEYVLANHTKYVNPIHGSSSWRDLRE